LTGPGNGVAYSIQTPGPHGPGYRLAGSPVSCRQLEADAARHRILMFWLVAYQTNALGLPHPHYLVDLISCVHFSSSNYRRKHVFRIDRRPTPVKAKEKSKRRESSAAWTDWSQQISSGAPRHARCCQMINLMTRSKSHCKFHVVNIFWFCCNHNK